MRINNVEGLLPGLVTFTKVVEGGSFSAAGRAMLLSPSAVARQIDRLEKDLNVVLLQRTTRYLQVTEAGREIYAMASAIVGKADELLARSQTYSKIPQGFLRITAPVTLGKMVLAPLLPHFLEQYPDVYVDMDLSDNLADLLRERYDLAVRVTNRPSDDLVARTLMPVKYVMVCARKYGRNLPTTLGELEQHSVFMPKDRGFGTTCCFEKGGQEYQITIQPRLVTNNGDAMLDALLQGRGIGILPDFVAQRLIESGELVVVLPDFNIIPPQEDIAYIISPPNYLLPEKARVFIDFMIKSTKR
ncbi:LysR family transcriptional regulator [Martelella alba]|uniref:LysR family transcriptional regulator n=1 Tax=Martelella alba TaxID=2590451 RepID=A0ABY2SMS9_9HYPH|nr:LysR family transcriptional regulator [Martelella alba]TKI06523.1 LysR family transcriptional regulator [Martelella alba]